MLVAMFLIGAGQSWLYQRAINGIDFYLFLYAISLYPLIMIAFDDEYSLWLNNLVAIVFGLSYFLVLRTISLHAVKWSPALRKESL
jgi:hypothetical protein